MRCATCQHENPEGSKFCLPAVRESLRIADDLGSPFSRTAAYSNMGGVHLVAGEFEEAERFFADALELQRSRCIALEHETGIGATGHARLVAKELAG